MPHPKSEILNTYMRKLLRANATQKNTTNNKRLHFCVTFACDTSHARISVTRNPVTLKILFSGRGSIPITKFGMILNPPEKVSLHAADWSPYVGKGHVVVGPFQFPNLNTPLFRRRPDFLHPERNRKL